jgi:hypothetical protein
MTLPNVSSSTRMDSSDSEVCENWDKEFKRKLVRMVNKLKEDTYNHLNGFKKNTNKNQNDFKKK